MFPFRQMGHNQALPVFIQHVIAALILQYQPASPLPRLQNQMDLRIMAQWLEMADAFHSLCDCFLIYNTSGTEFRADAEPL